ncbi:MAG: hypothetical protein IPK19_35645 [Chloroflexi bacterium]|nr:hypothetical protein [Chloroflexota bacterium]
MHFIPYMIGAGFDSSTAAVATGAIGLMQVGGRVLFAPLERRLSMRTLMVAIFGLQTFSLALLLAGNSAFVFGVFILLFGAAQGAGTLARPAILANLYGAANFGRIASIMTIFLTAASTTAPLMASLIYDGTCSYQPVVWVVVAFGTASTGVALLARREIVRTSAPAVSPANAA